MRRQHHLSATAREERGKRKNVLHLNLRPFCAVLAQGENHVPNRKLTMQTAIEESVLVAKTKELCQTILDQPEYHSLRRRIDTFLSNDEAKTEYQTLSEKGEYLHHKQHQGLALTDAEIKEFEVLREKFFKNP